jgi:hypothetical protein
MKMKTDPMDVTLKLNLGQCVEFLANDLSVAVLCSWVEPGLYYLTEKQVRKFSNLIHHKDVEVKTAIALHFSEVYRVTKEVTSLLSEPSPSDFIGTDSIRRKNARDYGGSIETGFRSNISYRSGSCFEAFPNIARL